MKQDKGTHLAVPFLWEMRAPPAFLPPARSPSSPHQGLVQGAVQGAMT